MRRWQERGRQRRQRGRDGRGETETTAAEKRVRVDELQRYELTFYPKSKLRDLDVAENSFLSPFVSLTVPCTHW
jgi:hypothetical protein